jgi:putative acetyltransferase
MEKLRLREAANSDADMVRELVFTILTDYGLKPDPATTDSDLADIEGSYFSRGGAFYVYEDSEGAVVGSTGLYPMEEKTCELRKMYLHPEMRGLGLGKKLLEFSLDEARNRGFRRVVLETASVLQEAVQLYRDYGFREYEPPHISCRCDQAFYLDLE